VSTCPTVVLPSSAPPTATHKAVVGQEIPESSEEITGSESPVQLRPPLREVAVIAVWFKALSVVPTATQLLTVTQSNGPRATMGAGPASTVVVVVVLWAGRETAVGEEGATTVASWRLGDAHPLIANRAASAAGNRIRRIQFAGLGWCGMVGNESV